MSVDVSRLAIEVQTTGIKEASTALGGLSRAAGTADKRVASLTDKLAAMMRAGGNATGVISGLTGSMGLINSALQSAAANAAALAQSLASTTQGMNSLNGATNQATGALREKAKWGGVVQSTLKAMATAALAYVGINFMKHSVEAADGWMLMQAKLKIATGSLENGKYAQQELFDMANKLMVPMEGVTKLFTRMAPAMRNNNKSFGETKDVVEGVALALKLNGATAGEVSSVMLQFSQSMQKGYLDGAEFNAVAENGSLLMQALSRHFNKGTGELKKMGSQAKITREELAAAIAANLPQWRKDFESLPITVDGAVQRIKNSWIKAMGEMSSESGLNKGLVEALKVVELMIPAIRDELTAAFVSVFKWIGDNRETLGEIWTQVKGIVSDVWNFAGAISAGVGALVGMNEGFSVIGFALFAVRLAWAGIQDGMTLVGAAILGIGGHIIDAVLSPLMEIATKPLKWLLEGFTALTGLLGRAAEAVGLSGLAGGLKTASDFGSNMTASLQGVNDNFKGIGVEMKARAADALEMLANGDSATQRLLAGEQSVTMEVQKRLALNKAAWDQTTGPADKKAVDKEAEKAHNKAMKEANSELEKSIKLYTELAQTYELIQKYGLDHDKLTAAEKELIQIDRDLLIVKDAGAKKTLEQARANAIASIEIEKVNKLLTDTLKLDADDAKNQGAKIAAAEKEVRTLQDKINLYGQAKGAVEELALTNAKLTLQAMIDGGETDASIARQRRLVAVLEEVKVKSEELGQLELGTKIAKQFDALKPADFGNAFGDAFGSIGKAIDKAGKSLDQYNKKMVALSALRKDVLNSKVDEKRAKQLDAIRKDELKANIDMYADMAGSIKGFFKEKTAAYKVFDAFEKGLRLAQMALVIEEMLTKVFASETATAAKATETTAGVAMDATSASSSISASLAKAAASTTAGVAKAFEQMGVWGFVGAAAILAFMAAVGFSGGSGGSAPNMTAEQRQKTQGTGSVLGDETAKSESIANSLDELKGSYNMGLEYSSRMLMALRSIDGGIKGMASFVAAATGVRGTTADQYAAGVGQTKGALGFSSSSTEMTDSGLQFDPGQTIGSMAGGKVNVQSYYDLHKEKSSWWGLSKSKSDEHHTAAVDAAFKQQVSATVANMMNLANNAAGALGLASDGLSTSIGNLSLGIDKVSLKGLSGEDLEKELAAAFSKLGDSMASVVMGGQGGLAEFQRVGEGSLETLVRLSSGVETAKQQLDNLGVSMIRYGEITNKQGDVAVELIRQSLAIKEAGSNVSQFISEMDGSAQDLIDAYKELVDIRGTLRASGLSGDVTRGLMSGAGGLDGLSSSLSDFISGFYTDTEQAGIQLSKVREQFTALGRTMPTSKAGLRDMIEALMHGDEASQKMAGQLMGLSGAYSDAMDAMTEATTAATEDARSALSDAYDRESEALMDLQSRMNDYIKSLAAYKDSLLSGDLSTLSDMEKYANAKAAYDNNTTLALQGNADAIGKFQSLADEMLQMSRSVNASGAGYTADFERVLSATDAVMQNAQGQVDAAQAQLDVLKQQVGTLLSIDQGVKTVAEALQAFAAASGVTVAVNGSHANGLSNVPFDGYVAELHKGERVLTASESRQYNNPNDALCAEIAALRAEVQALREDQDKQTDALVTSNYDAAERNAQAVVEGTKEAAVDAAYSQRKIELN